MQNRKEKKRKKKRKEIILPNIPKYVVTQFCHFVCLLSIIVFN